MATTEVLSQFTLFSQLPPEIRHQIYLDAIPTRGINFFNVHAFPNDHQGCNRSTSPPHLRLDLRRLSIKDNDEDVFEYDPSVWQVREALRQTCHEARDTVDKAFPREQLINLSMTQPKDGLFTRAGDGLLRFLTPENGGEYALQQPVPLVHRQIWVHADEMLVLSIENCSFNLPFEEQPSIRGEVEFDFNNVGSDMGWAYDPEFDHPAACFGIAEERLCLNIGREDNMPALNWAFSQIWPPMFAAVCGREEEYEHPQYEWLMTDRAWIMLDDETAISDKRNYDGSIMFWDRWGDCYTEVSCDSQSYFTEHQLAKVHPENNNIRRRYLQSSILRSPKRPI